jgi:hypothetical protein
MTKRKDNPRKRGRKNLARGIREQVYLRWRIHFRKRRAEEPKLTKEQIGKEFVAGNQPWFLELGISISDYPTLRNVLMDGLAERRARRRANWGIVTNLAGQRFISSKAPLIRDFQERALLGKLEPSGSPLIAATRKLDPN